LGFIHALVAGDNVVEFRMLVDGGEGAGVVAKIASTLGFASPRTGPGRHADRQPRTDNMGRLAVQGGMRDSSRIVARNVQIDRVYEHLKRTAVVVLGAKIAVNRKWALPPRPGRR
jgi:hypothetical protein